MPLACAALCSAMLTPAAKAQEKLHYTYLWHMEQPIYWPDQQLGGADRYERAWESILRTDAGAANPSNNLREIFGKPDRVAAYQYRVRESIGDILWTPEGGVQVSYSGGLIENLQSLGGAGQLGYSGGWFNDYRTARSWTTSGGEPRCDIVVFPFHHPLCPLIADSTLRKQIRLYQAVYGDAWGSGPGMPGMSRGFFPSEMAFSTRMIGVLADEGIDWAFVSSEKLSRACADFPVQLGSGGVNCDPPNRADQINPVQGSYARVTISRGCAPAEAFPFAFTPHRAQHVDPATGQVRQITVVPCAQSIGWQDGYNPIGTGPFDTLQTGNNPSRPMLVVMAHDGDNAWGGGFSYYREAVKNLASAMNGSGYTPTTVEQYLRDHPVPASDVVHVEDGAWVNADGDFGSPQFWNWNYPPVNSQGQVDIENGWAEDVRNWAVITAAQNHLDTAEQVWTDGGGTVDIDEILYPGVGTNPVERAWHFFMGALNSGYMYYGTAEDFEVKPAIACNEAMQHTAGVIGDGSGDDTGPTVWIPQRWPWNPGEMNYGAPYGYQPTVMPTDLWVWTFVHDVSDVQSVTLRYRLDADGVNPLSSTQNETYAGGAEVGAWQSVPMTGRAFPAGNVYNDPSIDFFEMPDAIADQYHAKLEGLSEVLVDYYVESVDARGNLTRSPIQHVWIGDGDGATGGGNNPSVTVAPEPIEAGELVTVTYDPSGGPLAGAGQVYLHYGFDNWAQVNPTDVPMDPVSGSWTVDVPALSTATQLDLVFNNGAGTWDNNNGQDWHYVVTGGDTGGGDPGSDPEWTMDGQLDADASLVASNGGLELWAGLKGDVLYLATADAGEGNDHFILLAQTPGGLEGSPWAKAGQVAAPDAFLADENDNDFEGWFGALGATQALTGPNGGVLEGTINLAQQYGSVPETVHAAVALYGTGDGAPLVSSSQVPPTLDGDGVVDADEYAILDLCSLGLVCCPADLNTTGTTNGQPDGSVNLSDLQFFLTAWQIDLGVTAGSIADVNTTGGSTGQPDGEVNLSDLQYYLTIWTQPCP